jgi:hypothetical protein
VPPTGLRPGRSALSFAAIAAAAIAARLPFLLRADRFFDADEAVEGLMARHVLAGEHPLFLWGQRYKGVPEVYLTAAVFRTSGSSVVALKVVTLACFVAFLWLNFRLLERVCSRGVAWIATAFFILGPPSLVLWTLSGSAEIVMTLVAGAGLLLALDSWERAEPHATRVRRSASVAAATALGAGLWIQSYVLYYVVSLAITAAIVTPGSREILAERVRARVPPWLRAILIALAAVAVLYVALGLVAFFTAGIDTTIAGIHVTATHPQKMWWIAGAAAAAAAGLVAAAIFRGQLLTPALGFLVGYLPALIGRIGNTGLGAPVSRLDFAMLRTALPDITGVMLPMLFGWRDPAARPTVFPALALVILVVAAMSYWQAWRGRVTPFFHVLPPTAAVMFLISGSYIDAQSYRYLMPMYAALPVVYAIGIVGFWRVSRVAGSALLVVSLAIFAAQQIDWYVRLTPDVESQRTIACLDAAGVHTARAGYWQSYKLTFLTAERVVMAPTDGVDRYSPYDALAGNSPTLDQIGCR